jgi:hypothetical protein
MMTGILRYVKVNSIKNEKVFLTGVNPPTGKHVAFVFERVSDAKTLESLNYAFQTGLFLKYLVGKNNMPFAEERPPKEREDSYFTFSSYCKPYGYTPLFLKNWIIFSSRCLIIENQSMKLARFSLMLPRNWAMFVMKKT